MIRNIDTDTLTTIKFVRALTDPIVAHDALAASSYETPDHILQGIRQARLRQVLESYPAEPIRKATWLETAYSFSLVSLLAPLNSDGQQFYKWSFRKALEQPGFPPTDHPVDPPAFVADLPDLPEHLRPELARTRRKLKIERDKHFFDTRYDPDCGIPKALWTDYHTGSITYDDEEFVRHPDDAASDAPA